LPLFRPKRTKFELILGRGFNKFSYKTVLIGVEVFYIEDKEAPLNTDFFASQQPVFTQTFTTLREVTARLNVPPGTYVIVPSTFEPGVEADFLLRIFMEKSHGTSISEDN